MPVKPSPPVESAARATLRPYRRWAQVRAPGCGATLDGRGRGWHGVSRPSESSIDRAMADAEQKGLGFHLRVRLAVLAVVAVSLVAYYAPARSIPGLLVVAIFAAFGLAQYARAHGMGGPSSGRASSVRSKRHC